MSPDEASATDPADNEDLSDLAYVDAVDELEAILAELEGDEVDIDILGTRVRRAAALIRLCRDRVASARMDVEEVVADLDQDPPDPG